MTSSETSASAFSSSDTAALERQAEVEQPVTLEQIWNENHRRSSVDWIRKSGYKRVCLSATLLELPSKAYSSRFACNSQTTICPTAMQLVWA